ncbi:MAG: hypothetical protein Q4G05_06640 [Clostridia bacterium]|nr:hypothetical protein [Clostridia bacterium]
MNKTFKKAGYLLCLAYLLLSQGMVCQAKSIDNSKLFTGTKKLFSDIGKGLIVLAPVIGGAMAGYFFIQMQMNDDEGETRLLKKKIKTCIVATIGVMIISGLLTIILNYYD